MGIREHRSDLPAVSRLLCKDETLEGMQPALSESTIIIQH